MLVFYLNFSIDIEILTQNIENCEALVAQIYYNLDKIRKKKH